MDGNSSLCYLPRQVRENAVSTRDSVRLRRCMVSKMGVAELVISCTNWTGLRQVSGASSESVGAALSELLMAPTPEAASAAYWRIENHAVVQGELFEVAEACVRVLVAAFADDRPRYVRISALELLFQILSGDSTDSNNPFSERCRNAAREGLWGLVREAIGGEQEAGWDVLKLMDLGERLVCLRDKA